MTNENFPGSSEVQLPDEYEKKVEEELRNHYENIYADNPQSLVEVLEEDLPEAVERELTFVSRVLDACQRWSQEDDPVVLWDIDETMGMYNLVENDRLWSFRPGMRLLVETLSTDYPNLRHGILTNRAELGENMELIYDFIDPELFFSIRNVQIPIADAEAIETEVLEELGEYPNKDHVNKLFMLRKLKEDGQNVHLIDDNKAAESIGEDGVCVYDIMPKL